MSAGLKLRRAPKASGRPVDANTSNCLLRGAARLFARAASSSTIRTLVLGFIPSFLRLECGWALVETNDRVRNAAEEHLRPVIVLRFHFPVPRYQFQAVSGNQDTPAKKKHHDREFIPALPDIEPRERWPLGGPFSRNEMVWRPGAAPDHVDTLQLATATL